MTVETFVQPNSSSQSASAYPGFVDRAVSVLTRLGDTFAPHQQTVANMTVALDSGHLMNGQSLVEVSAQSTSTITAPTTNPRIDRVVVDNITGAVSVITGTEAVSPTPPAIIGGKSPVAQVLLQTSSTSITNSMITDERDFSNAGTSAGGLLNIQTFTNNGTYTPTAGTSKVVVEVQGGGGSAGGTAATAAGTGAASSGGSAGSYAKALITSSFSGVSVTVGSGGAAPTAGNNSGNAGGSSSFGSLVVAPGGPGGNGSAAFGTPAFIGAGATSGTPTGANIVGGIGSQGNNGYILSASVVGGGTGGASQFGGGGGGGGAAAGFAAVSPGSGGGGSSSIPSSAARSGGAGAKGIVVVYEYA